MNPKRVAPVCFAIVFAAGCGNSVAPNSASAQGASAATPSISAAPSGASDGTISWTKYEDPLEQGFTVDVPKGWIVKGGLFRLGYSDHRAMVDMTSPDGKTNIRIGDVAIPVYFLPNQTHRQGDVYDLGAQAQGTVSSYRSGQEFADVYGKARFAKTCQSLTPQRTTTSPPLKVETPQSPGIATTKSS